MEAQIMTKKNSALIFAAVAVAAVVAFAPLVLNALFSNQLYNGVWGKSLGSLPVLRGGRMMPMSSAASDALRATGGRATAKVGGAKISATQWIWGINADFHKYASLPLLRTDNRQLQKLLGAEGRYVSYYAIEKNYEAIYKAATSKNQDVYSRACIDILNAAQVMGAAAQSLCVAFPDESSFVGGLENWRKNVLVAEKEFAESAAKKRKVDHSKLISVSAMLNYLRAQAAFEADVGIEIINTVPLGGSFQTPVAALLNRSVDGKAAAVIDAYAKIADSIVKGDDAAIKAQISSLYKDMSAAKGVDMFKIRLENAINVIDPFFCGLVLYALALLFMVLSNFKENMGWVGAVFLGAAALLHVLAICARVYIQMRPPVTNFYSSVVFTGGLAAVLAFAAYVKKGSVLIAGAGALLGVLSLLVAVNLPYSGDTMGMMRAVLNSNFWLSAHVMTIMVGYCGLFLTGFAASFRLVANAFSKSNFGFLTTRTANVVYLSLCACLLFTFTGTMLGGIWADMSWGRFWGWDPKENGALMVVLWTAGVIHCRALRVCNDRVFLALTALGNVVVAWAWFGVNLLGVGLHSYGFINGGWLWLGIFIFLQIMVAPFALLVYKGDNNI